MWKLKKAQMDMLRFLHRKSWRDFWKEEDGVGVVEIILILVVLIGLVILFKEQLTQLVQSLLSKAASQSSSI